MKQLSPCVLCVRMCVRVCACVCAVWRVRARVFVYFCLSG